MNEDDTPITDPVAAVDQAIASYIQLARALYGYYMNLLDAGFTEQQAFELTRDYQETLT